MDGVGGQQGFCWVLDLLQPRTGTFLAQGNDKVLPSLISMQAAGGTNSESGPKPEGEMPENAEFLPALLLPCSAAFLS